MGSCEVVIALDGVWSFGLLTVGLACFGYFGTDKARYIDLVHGDNDIYTTSRKSSDINLPTKDVSCRLFRIKYVKY